MSNRELVQTALRVPPAYFDLFRTHKEDGSRIRYKVFFGGRGSGKSWSIARALVAQAMSGKHLILCTRQFQNSIADSVHRVIQRQIFDLGVEPWFEITQNSIRCILTGSEFIFKGLARSINEIRSLEGVTRCWIEEAHSVTSDSWMILDPTIRGPGSEIWISFNPDSEEDAIYRMFHLDRGPNEKPIPPSAVVHKTSWRDNPAFPKELEELRLYMLANDPENYDWVFEGECRKITEAAVFYRKFSVETFDEPPYKTQLYHGIDFGYANDPTCLVRCWIRPCPDGKGEDLMIDREAYGTRVEIDEMVEFFDRHMDHDYRRWPMKADAARPETISYLCRQGLNVKAAEKWQGSVEDGISHLRGFRKIYIHETHCQNIARDFRLYSWKVDDKKDPPEVLPIPLDRNNHGPDAVRYALDGLIQMRGGLGVWLRLVRPNR